MYITPSLMLIPGLEAK